MEVYDIPGEFAFATSMQAPAEIRHVRIINKPILPFIAGTQALPVPTSLQELASITLQNNIEVHSITVICDSSALSNGVKYFIQFGNYFIGNPNSLISAIIPTKYDFDFSHYPVLYNGQSIIIYGVASATGSYLQLIVNGEII